MNIKNIIYIGVFIGLYVIAYFIAWRFSPTAKTSTTPKEYIVTFPSCDINDIPISINLCLDKDQIYSHIENTKYEIYQLGKDEVFIEASDTFFITVQSSNLNIFLINSSSTNLIKSFKIQLNSNETLLSSFYINNELYLNTLIEVSDAKFDRTKIYRIDLDKEDLNKDIVAINKMSRIIDINNTDGDNILLLKEPYSFLISFKAKYNWNSKQLTYDNNLKDSEFNLGSSTLKFDNNRVISLTSSKNEITLIEYLPNPQILYIKGRISTKINETVYNCIDLGESQKITFRACKSEL